MCADSVGYYFRTTYSSAAACYGIYYCRVVAIQPVR